MGPGEPLKMNAVETTRALGSFHVLSEFESELMGTPFSGHGVMSWDPAKKRFVSLWVDVMEPSPSLMEGTYDAESRTLSFVGENTMMGEKVKMREVLRHVDADHVVTELFATGKDGKETKSMQIDYARRK
jgi:hypothetical protein